MARWIAAWIGMHHQDTALEDGLHAERHWRGHLGAADPGSSPARRSLGAGDRGARRGRRLTDGRAPPCSGDPSAAASVLPERRQAAHRILFAARRESFQPVMYAALLQLGARSGL